jgi:predicted dehydrogenase
MLLLVWGMRLALIRHAHISNAMKTESQIPRTNQVITRRHFLAGAGTTLAAATLIEPSLIFGAEANSKVNIGVVGCGGRGRWITKLFQEHGGYNIAAVADYFEDRVNQAGQTFNVPENMRFTGLSGYKRMLEQSIDVLVIETAPYFHPIQAADAVSAGKHVYMAKPIAVDVPGCVSVEQSSKTATSKKLCFTVDFQTRANKAYQDAMQVVHSGQLGKVFSVEAEYHCPLYFEQLDKELRKDPKNPEVRLRTWSIDRVLSGDVITEQNIHSLDVASWALNAEPLSAYGTGSRARPYMGDCWDRFAVIYHYPENVFVSFNSHQVGFGCDSIFCRVHCMEGTVETTYAGPVKVSGKEIRTNESSGALYKDGTVVNIATFHDSITKGDYTNPTTAPSVRSNLVTILGRTAAYEKREITWKELIARKEQWKMDLTGLKA